MLSPLCVRRMLSAMVLLTSRMTIFDTRFRAGPRRGELCAELSRELLVDVDSSPFANVLCENVLLDGVSGTSAPDPSGRGAPVAAGTSPPATRSAQKRCGFWGTVFVT